MVVQHETCVQLYHMDTGNSLILLKEGESDIIFWSSMDKWRMYYGQVEKCSMDKWRNAVWTSGEMMYANDVLGSKL